MELIYLQTPFRNDNQRIILASMLYWHKPIFFVSSFFRVWTWIWMVTETRDLLPRRHGEGNLRWDTDESMACTAVCRQVVVKKSKSAYDIPEKKFSVQSSLTSQFQGNFQKRSCKVEASWVWWIYSFIWLIRIHWLPNIPITFRDYPVHFRPFSQKIFYEHVYLCTAVLPWELLSIHPLPVIHL